MTPGARVASAAEILDVILRGEPAEKTLTRWARNNRYAGSKDRVAVRDHVFGALRCRRSFAALGGADSGRGLMIGALRHAGENLGALFNGVGHAPAELTAEEIATGNAPTETGDKWDIPDWLVPHFEEIGGEEAVALTARAPVFLRVNARRSNLDAAIEELAAEGITAVKTTIANNALEVTQGARRVAQMDIYRDGFVEVQDAASQAVVESLPLATVSRVLDYCAGGGGKTLAMAALSEAEIFAHDIAPARMKDLTDRTVRARAQVQQLETDDLEQSAPFDLVLCDAPCSGSGAWRRAPMAKWDLTPERLAELNATQDEILDAAAALVATDGTLAYATCSLFEVENSARVAAFLARNEGWKLSHERQYLLRDGADGFYVAHLTHV